MELRELHLVQEDLSIVYLQLFELIYLQRVEKKK
jgi:hypothetical protein